MENTITLISGQKIEVLMQDEVSLDIDCSLRYIESGKKEIEEYVEDVSKKRLDTIVKEAQAVMQKQIDGGIASAQEKAAISAKEVIDENISLMKSEIEEFIATEVNPAIEESKNEAEQSAQIASQSATNAVEAYNNLSSSLELAQEVASGNIGDIKYTLRTAAPHGAVFCNGQILTEEQYPDLYQMLIDNRLDKVSMTEYESQVATLGECKYFAIDEQQKIIKVPTILQQEDSDIKAYVVCYTGKDTEIDITQEIVLNNPFSLLDYKWSEYEITNASWLLSNGQFNSGATYISVYNLLLEIYNGTVTKAGVSVKLSTEAYEDTDFVINTADTTFRLPIKTADDYVVESYDDGTNWYRIYKSGWIEQGGILKNRTDGVQTFNLLKPFIDTNYTGNAGICTASAMGSDFSSCIYGICSLSAVSTTQACVRTVGWSDSSWIAYGQGAEIPQSRIYFYVGETIQDANIIAASQVLTEVAKKTDSVQAAAASMPSDRYIDLTIGASGTTYTAPANGYFFARGDWYSSGSGFYITMDVDGKMFGVMTETGHLGPAFGKVLCPVAKGDIVFLYYNMVTMSEFRFIYAEGEN